MMHQWIKLCNRLLHLAKRWLSCSHLECKNSRFISYLLSSHSQVTKQKLFNLLATCDIPPPQKKEIKSSLYSLNTLSGVTSERCPSQQLCAKAHTIKVATVAGHWQRMGDLIGSGFEPHNPAPKANVLPIY